MENNRFDLCLCSHFLFLYSQQRSLDFHLASIKELLRVGKEVRIFPLLQLDGKPSPYVDSVLKEVDRLGWQEQIITVNYEFQQDGNRMLKISR